MKVGRCAIRHVASGMYHSCTFARHGCTVAHSVPPQETPRLGARHEATFCWIGFCVGLAARAFFIMRAPSGPLPCTPDTTFAHLQGLPCTSETA